MQQKTDALPETFREYFTQLLVDMGIKPKNHIACLRTLAAVSLFEGTAARYNPLACEQRVDGSTDFNWAGVQNYPSLAVGCKAEAELFSNDHWAAVRTAMTERPYRFGMMDAWSAAYTWATVNFRTLFPHQGTLDARLNQRLPV